MVRHPLMEGWRRLFPGVAVAFLIMLAATFFLRSAMALQRCCWACSLVWRLIFSVRRPKFCRVSTFRRRRFLDLGVALLGLRLTIDDVTSLGWAAVAMVVLAVISTMLIGVLLARLLSVESKMGVLTGGAVGICGASAAMAISSVLPQGPDTKRQTLFTVIGVTALSTVAMVFYPVVGSSLSLSDTEMGLFVGATIHDVAQVVGAGYSVSAEVGDLGTFVKLLRVAMLVPVVLFIGIIVRLRRGDASQSGVTAPVPWFLIAFIALFVANKRRGNSSGYRIAAC